MQDSDGASIKELRRCSSPRLTPEQLQTHEAKLSRLAPAEAIDKPGGSIRIKVHAHIIHNGAQGNLTDDQVKEQIKLLNYGFGWKPAEGDDFEPPAGPTPINSAYRFDLVSIDRTNSATWYVVTPEDADAATELAMKTALHQGGRRELNLYFNAPAGGYLGWATFPWELDEEPRATNLLRDGVVVHNSSIPGGQAPYDQGDSAVHEVGHWLGLFHTFTGGCTGKEEGATKGDFIRDTGRQAGPTWECPTGELDTCKKGEAEGLGNLPDPYENFMDYSPDGCMGTFTKQQMLRANRNVKAYRADDAPVPLCGNGVLDEGEKCDIRIQSGTGKCPTAADCADGEACTKDEVIGSECQQQCFSGPITEPDDGTDGCCVKPAGGAESEDPDCEPEEKCGNGKLDDGEACDIAIQSGAGHCPTAAECVDSDSCTTDGVENAGTCNAKCSHVDKGPANGDMCCPDGANHNNDTDCAPVCGNNVVEPPTEECDPPSQLCDAHCQNIDPPKPAKPFRVNSMYLRDPHVWFSLFGCKDVTDVPISGDISVNIQINKQLTEDGDGDGNFDMSPVLNFNPYDTADGAASETTLVVDAKCKTDNSGCTAGEQKYDGDATSHETGQCLGKLTGTTNSMYTGGINQPTNQCFATEERDIAISIQGSNINLKKARVAAVYGTTSLASGGSLQTGLIRGFLTEADADATVLHVSGFDIVLSSVLAGGKDCCQSGFTDKESLDGAPGWWFYLNYTAVETVLH